MKNFIWYILIIIVLVLFAGMLDNDNNNNNNRRILNVIKNNGIKVVFNKSNDTTIPTIYIKDITFIDDIMKNESLGLGESFMADKWDTPNLVLLLKQIILNREKITNEISINSSIIYKLNILFYMIQNRFFNRNSLGKNSNLVAVQHYDISNILYENMLDKYMQYSCGYWIKGTKNLDDAQINKLKLICCKLNLKRGLKVLDVGCGFGGLSYFMAKYYNVYVTSISLSKEQIEYAKVKFNHKNINYKILDYRLLDNSKKFDRIVSVGMFEHVGHKNYDTFCKKMYNSLKDDGYFLLHFIGSGEYDDHYGTDRWIDKYIFPGGMLPSIKRSVASINKYFEIEDFQNFGLSYAKTLNEWHKNFDYALRNNKLEKKSTNKTFIKMWKFYLMSCQASFETRQINLWHFLLIKRNTNNIMLQSNYAREC